MNEKCISYFLIIALFVIPAPITFAAAKSKQIGDWNSLSSRLNSEIAVKAKNRKTVFGVLIKFNDAEIIVQSGGDTNSQIAFKREEIENIWLAKLKGGRNTGKGAFLGAGTGAAAGLIYVAANRKNGDGQTAVAVPVLAIFGAGIGAGIGFFAREKNRKEQLIYQR
jgi:hypothetical protein